MNLNLRPLLEMPAHPLLERLGWTLIHSLWQFTLIALLLGGGLLILRRRSAQSRYVAACAALFLCLIASLATFALLPHSPASASIARIAADEGSPQILGLSGDATADLPAPATPRLDAFQHVESLLPWSAMAWGVGVVVMSVGNLLGWLRVQRLRRDARPLVDRPWPQVLARLREQLGVRGRVMLALSQGVDAPAVIGCFKSIILLPPCALSGLSPQQLEALLAHELSHVRRLDYLVNLLQTVIETLLFHHPAVWWMSRVIRREREHCCDDAAANACGDARRYAHALVRMEELRIGTPASFALGASGGGTLLPRIRRLLGIPGPGARRMRSLPATVVGIVCVLVPVLVGPLQARQHDARDEQPATQPQQQPVKAGDWLAISITDLVGPGVQSNYTAQVSEKQTITLGEPVGVIIVREMPPSQIERAIAMRLRERNIVQNAQVTVRPAPPLKDDAVGDPELRRVLQQRMPGVRFDNSPLADVIEFLRDTTGANIVVSWRALESQGIDRNSTVSLQVRNVSLEKLLRIVLEDVSVGTARLSFVADQNVIMISTEDDLERMQRAVPTPAPQATRMRRDGVYYISGVERSGTYALAGEITLGQALMAAGTKGLAGKHLILIREDPTSGETRRMVVSLSPLVKSVSDMPIEPNDVLMVTNKPDVLQPVPQQKYRIEGLIPKPGEYGLDGRNMSLLQALIAAGADPSEQAALWVTLTRRITEGGAERKIYVGQMADLAGTEGSLRLRADDRIVVSERTPEQ